MNHEGYDVLFAVFLADERVNLLCPSLDVTATLYVGVIRLFVEVYFL